MTRVRWPGKTAVGSSYCLDQSPGAERFGGLAVTIRWRAGETGTVTTRVTSYFRDDAEFGESLAQQLGKVAEEGLREEAAELNVDLSEFDITFSDFAYHDIDSRGEFYRHAAATAFRSAIDAWQRWYRQTAKDRDHYYKMYGLE